MFVVMRTLGIKERWLVISEGIFEMINYFRISNMAFFWYMKCKMKIEILDVSQERSNKQNQQKTNIKGVFLFTLYVNEVISATVGVVAWTDTVAPSNSL